MKTIPTSLLFAAALFAGFAASPEDNQPGPASARQPAAAIDKDSLAKLRQEEAALKKRLMEIDAEIIRISRQRGRNFLGMTLVDPSVEALDLYGFGLGSTLPMITGVNDPSFFPDGMTPYKGCAFWIVENPAKGFLFNHDTSPSYRPKTVHDFIEAIIASTVTPEEYQKLYDRCNRAAQAYFNTLKDSTAEQKRLHRITEWQMPAAYVGKCVCRVVYDYPQNAGTMTTDIRMTRKDLDQLREMLKERNQ